MRQKWAVILAGGDGKRLLELTRRLTGDSRPKQFCRLVSDNTLLDETRARVASYVDRRHTLFVLRDDHRPFYEEPLAGISSPLMIEQPGNRGTAAAITYATERIARTDEDAVVGFFPADHYYSNPGVLRRAVDAAYFASRLYPDRVFLVGAEANWPDTEYGWIEPGLDLETPLGQRVSRVMRFWEKPERSLAHDLFERRCLWNTFIMVGCVQAFRQLTRATLPSLGDAFEQIVSTDSIVVERSLAAELYQALPSVDFCADILARAPDRLGVIRMSGAGWTDLGQPGRLAALVDARTPARAAVGLSTAGHGAWW